MRLLHHPAETPSLETWLGRDVPHEREMAGTLLDQMGREKALDALLALHDREETKLLNQRRRTIKTHLLFVGASCSAFLISALPPLNLMPVGDAVYLAASLTAFSSLVSFALVSRKYIGDCKSPPIRQNIINALFEFTDSPLIADPLCRAIGYYDAPDRWEVFANLMRVLPLLPNEKDALTKEGRKWLRNRLVVMENRPAGMEAGRTRYAGYETERVRYADFEIAVLRYFARTRDRDALPAIRKLAKAKPFSDDGRRVQDAARIALQAFSEPAA